jgi:hypothetical protein
MSLIIYTKTRKVDLGRTFDQIDESELLNCATRTSDTTKQYETIISKLKVFLMIPEDGEILRFMLTDKTLALFSHEFGRATNFHKSQYKKMNGALNWLLCRHSLSNFFDFPHDWPKMFNASTVSINARCPHAIFNLLTWGSLICIRNGRLTGESILSSL